MVSAPCVSCGASVDFDPEYSLGNQDHGVMCQDCIVESERKLRASRRANAALLKWRKICPPRYIDTELGLLPYPDKGEAAITWDFPDGAGLNLWGYPDTGKTRTMFLVLRELHFAGHSIRVFSPGAFCAELESREFKRGPWIKDLNAVDYLAFDDMDKLNLTKEQELVFFGVVDSRMSQKKPCLFTHNSSAEELQYRFKNGRAMVRRIRQFTRSIHFPSRVEQKALL